MKGVSQKSKKTFKGKRTVKKSSKGVSQKSKKILKGKVTTSSLVKASKDEASSKRKDGHDPEVMDPASKKVSVILQPHLVILGCC